MLRRLENIEKMLDNDEKQWARIEKMKEEWFVLNGVSFRYSMREHALISGLHCHEYHNNYEEMGDFRFVERHFKNTRVTQEAVEKKFLSMRMQSRDRFKMAVLYFLSSVIGGNAKRGPRAAVVSRFLRRVVTNLDGCRSFPWGRLSYFDNLKEIERMFHLFNGAANPAANFPSFIIPLELLPFEAIPNLMRGCREEVMEAHSDCPRMCKS